MSRIQGNSGSQRNFAANEVSSASDNSSSRSIGSDNNTAAATETASSASRIGELRNYAANIKYNVQSKGAGLGGGATASINQNNGDATVWRAQGTESVNRYDGDATLWQDHGQATEHWSISRAYNGFAGGHVIELGDENDVVEISQEQNRDVRIEVNGGTRYLGQDEDITLRTGGGNDIVHVLPGVDRGLTIQGGDGSDIIAVHNSPAGFILDGGNDNDNIQGSSGPDIMVGGRGDDIIDPGVGANTVDPGLGNDFIVERTPEKDYLWDDGLNNRAEDEVYRQN